MSPGKSEKHPSPHCVYLRTPPASTQKVSTRTRRRSCLLRSSHPPRDVPLGQKGRRPASLHPWLELSAAVPWARTLNRHAVTNGGARHPSRETTTSATSGGEGSSSQRLRPYSLRKSSWPPGRCDSISQPRRGQGTTKLGHLDGLPVDSGSVRVCQHGGWEEASQRASRNPC